MEVFVYYNLFKGGLSDKAKLKEYAKAHNYKPGWAYFQARKRGMIA